MRNDSSTRAPEEESFPTRAVAVTVAPSGVVTASDNQSPLGAVEVTVSPSDDDENSELNQPVKAADKEAEAVVSTMACHPPLFTAVSVFQDPITYTAYRPFGIDEPHDGDYSLSARWKFYTSTLVFLFFLFYYMIYIIF